MTLKHVIGSRPMDTGDAALTRHRDRRRAGRGALRRHRPPRHQAREYLRDQARPRQDSGLRVGQGQAGGQLEQQCDRSTHSDRRRTRAPDQSGHHAGNGGLHVSGAGARARNWMRAPTCFRLARCCTKWRRATLPFRGERPAVICSTPFCTTSPGWPGAVESGTSGRVGTDHQ